MSDPVEGCERLVRWPAARRVGMTERPGCWSDLADAISQAADSGAKVILAGDTQQLQAVESGGGLSC